MDYITRIETLQTGGNCTIDLLHLKDGRVIGINDESICLYESKDQLEDGGCIEGISIPKKKMVSYDFQDGQLVEIFHGRPQASWSLYDVPDEILRKALQWNDRNGDFDDVPRVHLLEIFLVDFIQSRKD